MFSCCSPQKKKKKKNKKSKKDQENGTAEAVPLNREDPRVPQIQVCPIITNTSKMIATDQNIRNYINFSDSDLKCEPYYSYFNISDLGPCGSKITTRTGKGDHEVIYSFHIFLLFYRLYTLTFYVMKHTHEPAVLSSLCTPAVTVSLSNPIFSYCRKSDKAINIRISNFLLSFLSICLN